MTHNKYKLIIQIFCLVDPIKCKYKNACKETDYSLEIASGGAFDCGVLNPPIFSITIWFLDDNLTLFGWSFVWQCRRVYWL